VLARARLLPHLGPPREQVPHLGVLLGSDERRPLRRILDTAVNPKADVRRTQRELLDRRLVPQRALFVLPHGAVLALLTCTG